MNHSEKAVENFKTGCNCAQSVFVAFTDVTGLDRETAMKFASGFGGGMGGMKEVCGVLSGAFMVLGAAKGLPTHRKRGKRRLHGHHQSVRGEFRSQ
jgi:C_GCAxxG_C_C family probable redox protein